LSLSEDGRINGDVTVRYELLGEERVASGTVVVAVYNRNSFRWDEATALASFISPTDPVILDYTKYIAGISRNERRGELNQSMQLATYLYEGLRAAGVARSYDETTPYAEYHLDSSLLDTIQVPFQTLAYRSGDIDDIGLLYAETLEAAGIQAAIIPLENDFLVAANLKLSEQAASSYFYNMGNLLIVNDEVWLPVSLSRLAEGFINSWYAAVNSINEAFANEEDVSFIILEDAWIDWPPAALDSASTGDVQYTKPAEATVARLVETDMMRYISAEFNPKIADIQEEIRENGGTPVLYNRLGIYYLRSGMAAEAKKNYEIAAGMGSLPALLNLGSLALEGRDYDGAAQWFQKALEADPGNADALDGLAEVDENRVE
jgi:tetratricopeptide (TPR) repeat protein